MNKIPEVVGLYLDDALLVCQQSGFDVSIKFTRPVKEMPQGKPRVVRFNKVSTNRGVLTVVYEYIKGGG